MNLLGHSDALDLSTFRVSRPILEAKQIASAFIEIWAVDLLSVGFDMPLIRELTGATKLDEFWCHKRTLDILQRAGIVADQTSAETIERLAITLYLRRQLSLSELLEFGVSLNESRNYESLYDWWALSEDVYFTECGERYRLTGVPGETAEQLDVSLHATLAYDLTHDRRNPDFMAPPSAASDT